MELHTISISDLDTQKRNEETTKLNLITPVLERNWGSRDKIVMEYVFTDGRISIDEYDVAHRGKQKKADYILLHNENIMLAVVEAKGQYYSADEGFQQACHYARILGIPFAFATNGIDLIEIDLITGHNRKLKLKDFPSSEELWDRYNRELNISYEQSNIIAYPYYYSAGGKKPRYYQRIAINRTIEAITKGQNRVLLVMATGTGKTFTAFQIIWRLWKTQQKKKILFLADRNILVDQTMQKDFKPFTDAMTKFDNSNFNTSQDIYLSLYQQLKSAEKDYFKRFPSDFFDLIVVDECHRSSANPDSNWHEILEYFKSATQIGLTATPKEDGLKEAIDAEEEVKLEIADAIKSDNHIALQRAYKALEKATERRQQAERESNAGYFGNPIYTYSLKQGIEDGFLAPYKVLSVELDIDKYGYRPKPGDVDQNGNAIEDRIYFQNDFDKRIVIEERRQLVAKRITDYMKANDRYAKTILFCEDIDHCQEMVRLLQNENADLVAEDSRYIMQITGDNAVGKAQLDNFVDPSSKYPVIAITSRLMSTGVDAETCHNIILDRNIGSMTEFKQIIGRGTRIKKHYEIDGKDKEKMFFTILDFRKNYHKFQDPSFDGEPVTVTDVPQGSNFPKTPVKPDFFPTDPIVSQPKRITRVEGVDANIIGEKVHYIDENGNLVVQNLDSCVRNNILTQYPTQEEFKGAWLLAKDKNSLAEELLLDSDWGKRFKIQYGYDVDNYDIIGCIAYDIKPPMSKNQRAHNAAIANFIDSMDNEKKKEIVRILLDAYVVADFKALKDIKTIFSMQSIKAMGYAPLSIIKTFFVSKDNYYKFLNELENKLYI